MKRNRLILLALALMGLLTAQKVCAWTGSTLTDVAGKTDDNGKFYLYNVATGKFMSQGAFWGTCAIATDAGIQFTSLTSLSNGKYKISAGFNGGAYIGLSTGYQTINPHYYFLDNASIDVPEFTIANEGGNTYSLSSEVASDVTQTNGGTEIEGMTKGTYYMSVDKDGNCKAVTTKNDSCIWMLITLTEIKNNFNNTEGTTAHPAYAQHLIYDAGFYRENPDVGHWKMSKGKSLDNYYFYTLDETGTTIKDNSYNNGIKPADAIAQTTTVTTDAEYTYKIVCTYTSYSLSGIKSKEHTIASLKSTTPLAGVTEVDEETTLTRNFIDCGENHYDYDRITKQVVTLTSYKPGSTTTVNNGGYTYHIGNGYNMHQPSGANIFEDGNTYNSQRYQEPFGEYWTANIHGTQGSISQQITPGRKGWWKVTAKGFSNDGHGNLFAYAGGTNQENTDKYQVQPFNTVDTEAEGIDTYVKASKYLKNTTSQAVTVYVGSTTETLTFGAYIKEGEGTNTSWTCFDDVVLAYLGEGELNLIIDEENEVLGNINGQVNTAKNQTLRLIRTLKTDKWNSLVLPVKLTAQQVKTAFGAETKLSKLDRTEAKGKRIFFEKVDLSKDDNDAILAGGLYIIKPQNAMPVDQDPKTRMLNDETTTITTDVDGNGKSSYYTINQVSLVAEVAQQVETEVVGSEEDSGIKMVGTYLYKKATGTDHSIPANSYILSDGVWYYHTAGVHNVKGLRGWIQTNEATTETKFFINGIEEGEATAIEGIENSMEVSTKRNSNIYNLNGQLVRSNSTSVEGLDKGIYIIGGKKVVVK